MSDFSTQGIVAPTPTRVGSHRLVSASDNLASDNGSNLEDLEEVPTSHSSYLRCERPVLVCTCGSVPECQIRQSHPTLPKQLDPPRPKSLSPDVSCIQMCTGGMSSIMSALDIEDSSLDSSRPRPRPHRDVDSAPIPRTFSTRGRRSRPTSRPTSPLPTSPSSDLTPGRLRGRHGPIYTLEEIRQHCSEKSCWIIAHGRVYDATTFLKYHPGGVNAILRRGGQDTSRDFDFHSAPGRAKWDKFCIGEVEGSRRTSAQWMNDGCRIS
eukprot:TRINITY_DN15071_c0_g1_i1.p1 TRINITY_DN15071_c0_g1~~TRINITY_DN15071_c0_g1_i1.p1  ORF type:complete len:266 (+),score=16.14 TRINITY_DN15071_c0_g1_i1:181-978(+)